MSLEVGEAIRADCKAMAEIKCEDLGSKNKEQLTQLGPLEGDVSTVPLKRDRWHEVCCLSPLFSRSLTRLRTRTSESPPKQEVQAPGSVAQESESLHHGLNKHRRI